MLFIDFDEPEAAARERRSRRSTTTIRCSPRTPRRNSSCACERPTCSRTARVTCTAWRSSSAHASFPRGLRDARARLEAAPWSRDVLPRATRRTRRTAGPRPERRRRHAHGQVTAARSSPEDTGRRRARARAPSSGHLGDGWMRTTLTSSTSCRRPRRPARSRGSAPADESCRCRGRGAAGRRAVGAQPERRRGSARAPRPARRRAGPDRRRRRGRRRRPATRSATPACETAARGRTAAQLPARRRGQPVPGGEPQREVPAGRVADVTTRVAIDRRQRERRRRAAAATSVERARPAAARLADPAVLDVPGGEPARREVAARGVISVRSQPHRQKPPWIEDDDRPGAVAGREVEVADLVGMVAVGDLPGRRQPVARRATCQLTRAARGGARAPRAACRCRRPCCRGAPRRAGSSSRSEQMIRSSASEATSAGASVERDADERAAPRGVGGRDDRRARAPRARRSAAC